MDAIVVHKCGMLPCYCFDKYGTEYAPEGTGSTAAEVLDALRALGRARMRGKRAAFNRVLALGDIWGLAGTRLNLRLTGEPLTTVDLAMIARATFRKSKL